MKKHKIVMLFLLMITFSGNIKKIEASKLKDVRVVDKQYLMVHFLDGEISHRDDGIGPNAFSNSNGDSDGEKVTNYDPALNTAAAQTAGNWTIKSTDDPNYSSGLHPEKCFRKTKMNGHAQKGWSTSAADYVYIYTYEHLIFLKLPHPMQQDKSYTLEINGTTNSDKPSNTIKFDIFQNISEAIHVNLVGYHPDPTIKAADLYIWMGDGNARDYSTFEGNKVYIYDIKNKISTEVGKVVFWKKSAKEGSYDLTRSDVWNADFSSFSKPGTYRLAIEGVGCSQEFKISDSAYHDPFMVSVQGFFYMRIGEDSTGGIWPVPRRPLYIPEKSPANTKVYLTTMHPYHSEWKTFSKNDAWDNADDWARFRKSGNPTNPKARGGHSDALDWDRHLGHVSIIYDMLLPYFLTGGAINNDNLDIAESGNGIPDILDEAKNEVDFWLNVRDGLGYGHGLTNPNKNNEFFQGGPTAIAAWANAVNAAMLADCFRISGHTNLMNEYRDSAITAFNYANGLDDKMLDNTQSLGEATIRGRDLKMTAAAYLYNVTGETKWENIIKDESVVKDGIMHLSNSGRNQTWGTAAYLLTNRKINYPELHANMKASIINQAKQKEANNINSRPSRRSNNSDCGYFRVVQNVHHTIIAHRITDQLSDKAFFCKALILEADYGLGRNTMNMIQMTTATTPLENKRSVINAYTTGSDDGAPGMHPGHTPYMNLDDWGKGMTMSVPSRLYENCYPADFMKTWPIDEGYFNTKYVWAHNEFTPQQTMRGKMALYGYLYGISKNGFISGISRKPFKSVNGNLLLKKNRQIKTRLLDCSGRVIWSGNEIINSQSLVKSIPVASGIFFIEQIIGGEKYVRLVTKQ